MASNPNPNPNPNKMFLLPSHFLILLLALLVALGQVGGIVVKVAMLSLSSFIVPIILVASNDALCKMKAKSGMNKRKPRAGFINENLGLGL